MADGVKITVRGKDRLFRKLRRSVKTIEEELTVEGGKSANEMVQLARGMVPRKAGDLMNSIVATPPGGTPPDYGQGRSLGSSAKTVPEGAWMVTAGNPSVRYPHLVEFGTAPHVVGGMFAGALHPGTPAQPYFFPAYRIIRKKHKGRASRGIGRALKRAGR